VTLQAAMYGSLVLAAQMGKDGVTKEMVYGGPGPDDKKLKSITMPEVNSATGPSSWIEKDTGGRASIPNRGTERDHALIPLYKLLDERYSVYWKVNARSA
jgi:uncharacterized protein